MCVSDTFTCKPECNKGNKWVFNGIMEFKIFAYCNTVEICLQIVMIICGYTLFFKIIGLSY